MRLLGVSGAGDRVTASLDTNHATVIMVVVIILILIIIIMTITSIISIMTSTSIIKLARWCTQP